jgi:hypothetical protein
LSVRNSSYQIEQENEQVIGMTGSRRQRFVVSYLKIDQPCAPRFLVIDHISHRGIAMRPVAAEFLVFEMMRAPIFTTGGFQHSWREGPPVHVIPQIVAGQFVQHYGATVPDLRTKTVAVEHLKTPHFPPPPFPYVAQVANWNAGCMKVKVDQIGSTLAVNVPPFNHDLPFASGLFRNRINFERFHKRSRAVRKTLRNEKAHQRFSIFEIKHDPAYPSLCSLKFERRSAFNRLNPATKSFRPVSSRAVGL